MFSWPWQKKAPPEPPSVDRVWGSLSARDRALVRAAQAGPLVVLAFFDETVDRVRAALGQAGLSEGPRCSVARVDQLERRPPDAQLIIAERHPLPANNRALLERLQREAPLAPPPVFFSALDEPFLLRMMGPSVGALMSRLGLSDDEPIEHPMIARALKNAREKAAQRFGAKAPLASSSMAEWLQRNLPG